MLLMKEIIRITRLKDCLPKQGVSRSRGFTSLLDLDHIEISNKSKILYPQPVGPWGLTNSG